MKENTLTPVWDELWRVKNVPHGATLAVEVMDKDSNSLTDGYIGQLTLELSSGEKEIRIEDRVLKRNRGTFLLKVRLLRTSYASIAISKRTCQYMNGHRRYLPGDHSPP